MKDRLDDWSETPLPGMRKLAVGDVVRLFGGECLCLSANRSNAVVRSLAVPAKVTVTLGGKEVGFAARAGVHRISTQVDRELFVRRATRDEENKFLRAPAARPGEQTTETQAAGDDEDMKEKKAARGGLAATAMAEGKKRGPGSPAKTPKAAKATKVKAEEAPKGPTRKETIRKLYDSHPPLKKSEIVTALIAAGFGAEKDRPALKSAVDNEASYYKNDGGSPKWAAEDKPA